MPYSQVVIPSDGTTTLLTVNLALSYLPSTETVRVRAGNEVDGSNNPVYRAYTWVTPTQMQVSGSAPPIGQSWLIERISPKDSLIVNFADGDPIIAKNLDDAQKQSIHIAHEALDSAARAIKVAPGFPGPSMDALEEGEVLMLGPNNTIVAGPTAENIANAEGIVAAAAASALAAAASAGAASNSASAANTSAVSSAGSATASAASATSSGTSATNAAASATSASGSASAAATSATSASTSATNSANSATAANTSATNAANSAAAAAASAASIINNSINRTGDTVTGRYVWNRASGTGSSFSPDYEMNVSESYTAGSGFYIPWAVTSTKTGGTGHREAMHVTQLSGTSAAGEFIVGVTGIGHITGSGSGSVFGLNGYGWCDSTAASSSEVCGAEFNVDVRRSGGVNRKVGLQVVDVSTSIGAGTVFDCGVLMTKQAGGIGWIAGVQFGDSSQFPVKAGGHVITCGAAGIAPTLASGVNMAALPAPTIGAFVSPPNAKGLSFGTTAEGGLIQSTTLSGGGTLSFNSGNTSINTQIQTNGYRCRNAASSTFGGNYFNLYWTGSQLDVYIDSSRVGSVTLGA